MMNNQLNSPTQPLSDLYSLQTIQIKKITLPIFDETKLPSSWSSQQRKVLEETALKELEVQQRLTTAIRCAKICLEASLLTQEQTEQKLRELRHLYQMYYETKSIVDRFDRYLLDKHKPALRALAILDPVRRSMTELITLPHLQDSLSHMTISTDSPDSGACSKMTDSPSPPPNEPEDSSTGNAPI
jgi:primosomal protein N''